MGKKMISVGSVSRDDAALVLPFLAEGHSIPRSSIRRASHADPELVFWISPAGNFIDALDDHLKNPPIGFEHVIRKTEYGGFIPGRVARSTDQQFMVLSIRQQTLVYGPALRQLLSGLDEFPILVEQNCLVISQHGDLYGTIEDVRGRATFAETEEEVEQALVDPRMSARMAAASSQAASPKQLDKFLDDAKWEVRRAAAANPRISHAQLDRAMRDKNGSVRLAASENVSLSYDEVDRLLAERGGGNPSPNLRHKIGDPDVPLATLVAAMRHTDEQIRWSAFSNPSLPPDLLQEALEDADSVTRQFALININVTPAQLGKALEDQDVKVRRRASMHSALTDEQLLNCLNDEDEWVRFYAIGSPNFPARELWRWRADSSSLVSERALEAENGRHRRFPKV